jgi:hypothetical protein
MRKILFLSAAISLSVAVHSQNCTVTSVGLPPINDLGTNYWQGSQGGLYPNGSNYRPASHNMAGLTIASQIIPLDTSGNADLVNGKIVWLSIGMSNTTQETQSFLPMANSHPQKNPKLILIDGAQGGQDIDVIVNPNANYWLVVNQRLATAGLTPAQVQVIWFKQAEAGPGDTAFATYPDALKAKFRTAIQIIKDKYPNAKLAYLSSRIYAGYATTGLNPEPYAWYSGWSVKRLIEDQINGDTSLIYTGSSARAPWLAWGPYLWADGTTPRSDGLVWNCPTDYASDGTHPSNSGRQKVAQMLLDFFTSDSTSVPWFLNSSTGVEDISSHSGINIYPNPMAETFTVEFQERNFDLSITDLSGKQFYFANNISCPATIDCSQFLEGFYFVTFKTGKQLFHKKILVCR